MATFEENQTTLETLDEEIEATESIKFADDKANDTSDSPAPFTVEELRISNATCSVMTIHKMYHNSKRQEIDFDIPQQRGIAWNNSKRSLYIHSVLMGLHRFQGAIIVNKIKDKNGKPVYKVYDGKQRMLSALIKFVDGEYVLSGLKNEPLIDNDGEPYNIDRKSFKKLPDELRQRLMDASMNVCVVDNGSDEMMNLIFRRINSGEQMSSFDISRSHRENLDDIRTLSNHILFTKMLSKNTYVNLKQHELVVKTWIALYEEDPRFTGKHVDEVMSKIEITPEQSEEMTHIFDKIYDAYMILTERNKPVTKLMFNKTHFITYIPYVNKFDTAKSFADWLEQFFTNLPDEYIHAVSEGHSTTVNTVQRRFDIVSESINKFTNK